MASPLIYHGFSVDGVSFLDAEEQRRAAFARHLAMDAALAFKVMRPMQLLLGIGMLTVPRHEHPDAQLNLSLIELRIKLKSHLRTVVAQVHDDYGWDYP